MHTTSASIGPTPRELTVSGPHLHRLRASVRALPTGVASRRRYRAAARRLAVGALLCREGSARANAPAAAALRQSELPTAPPHSPTGGVVTCARVTVDVVVRAQPGDGAASPASSVERYVLPVLAGPVVAAVAGALPPPPRRVPGIGEASPTRMLHYLDLTSLSTQDNTLLRDKSSGELLAPCTLLCPAVAGGEAQHRGRPSGAAQAMKRRRIVVVEPDTLPSLESGGLELVSFVLKKPASETPTEGGTD